MNQLSLFSQDFRRFYDNNGKITKIPLTTIEVMNSTEISEYMAEITQTPICLDADYCKKLLKILNTKPL